MKNENQNKIGFGEKLKKTVGLPDPAIRIIEEVQNPDGSVTTDVHKGKRDFSQFVKFLNIVIIGLFMLVVAVCLLVLERPTVSYTENRALAKMPEFSWAAYFSGDYTDGISQYFNDTVPNRDKFKDMTSTFVSWFGFGSNDSEGGQLYGATVEIETSTREPETSKSDAQPDVTVKPTAPTTTTEPVGDEIEEGVVSNGILVVNNRGLMLYGGSYTVGRNYAGYLNTYKLQLGSKVNVYSMVIPTAVTYYLPKKYEKNSASQIDNIDNINSYFNGVEAVNVHDVLGEHKDEAIYSRTDHHWQPLGAYYAAQVFATQAGVPFADLSSYEKVVNEGYVGTLYGYTQNASLKNNPEQFIYYKPSNQYTTTYYDQYYKNPSTRSLFINAKGSSMYCTFLGSDELIAHIKTDVGNGRKLAIIKDSYGNALVPFLTGSFEEIYVIDMRYFKLNSIDFLKQQGVTDVLFASCAFSATGGNAKCIEKIRTQ